MKQLLLTTAFLGLSATLAQAAAIERTFTSFSILFEEGRYVELSLGTVNLDSSGRLNGLPISTGGGVMGNFNTYILGLSILLRRISMWRWYWISRWAPM